MKVLLLISTFAYLLAFGSSTIQSSEAKLGTKLTPINRATYEDDVKDLTASASDRTFHINKEYGQSGGYGGSVSPYGTYLGLGGSIYGPNIGYRGVSLSPGFNHGYRGYPSSGPGGIISGGNIGYGYYGTTGYNPSNGGYGYGGYGSYGGYGGYNGYGNRLGGYGGYSNGYAPGSYTSGVYDDGYYGYGGRGGGYGRYGGLGYDGYGYGTGYGGLNYGSSYNSKSNYDPFGYRGSNYGNYVAHPSGYRGYS